MKFIRLSRLLMAAGTAVAMSSGAGAQCETWQALIANGQTGVAGGVYSITSWNGSLVVGGNFTSAGLQQRNYIARWDGSAWNSFTSGGQTGVEAPFGTLVLALAVWNGDLYAAGNFVSAGGQTVNNIARWDGTAWHPMVANGQTGVNSTVRALVVWDNNLYAGGDFTTAGGHSVSCIAHWDGADWIPLVSNGQTGVSGGVRALAVWNGNLVAGGYFSTAGNVFVNRVAAWNGISWQAFIANGQSGVGGLSPEVDSLTEWNGSLVAGGFFSSAGGMTANNIARWDGSAWIPFIAGGQNGVSGDDIPPQVYALTSWNGELIAAGYFTMAGDQTVNHIARWNGTTWHAFSGAQIGLDNTALALASWNSSLMVGGNFPNAGGTFVSRIAQWDACVTQSCVGDVAPTGGDGAVNVADLLLVINSWGACGVPGNCPADIAPSPSPDGVVNVNDLLAVINAWGPCH